MLRYFAERTAAVYRTIQLEKMPVNRWRLLQKNPAPLPDLVLNFQKILRLADSGSSMLCCSPPNAEARKSTICVRGDQAAATSQF